MRPPNDFLGVCTAWRLRPIAGRNIANDQSDNIRYDAAVIGRLRDIDRATRPTMTRLTTASDRYESYQCQFATALRRIESGENEWFISHVDSYHATWFELHEDLLVTLDIPQA